MKTIISAEIFNLNDTGLRGSIYTDDSSLALRTPSGKVYLVVSVGNPQRVDYVLQAVVGLIKPDGTSAKMVVGGEVDVARALYLCQQKTGRVLVELENEKEMFEKCVGASFEVIKTLTKEEDVRIQCAYKY